LEVQGPKFSTKSYSKKQVTRSKDNDQINKMMKINEISTDSGDTPSFGNCLLEDKKSRNHLNPRQGALTY